MSCLLHKEEHGNCGSQCGQSDLQLWMVSLVLRIAFLYIQLIVSYILGLQTGSLNIPGAIPLTLHTAPMKSHKLSL